MKKGKGVLDGGWEKKNIEENAGTKMGDGLDREEKKGISWSIHFGTNKKVHVIKVRNTGEGKDG